MPTASIDDLTTVLLESQRLGFLGDRPVSEVIEHARAFVSALESVNGRVADIGSGGGVPGLILGFDRPDLKLVLIDRRTKRTDFLSRAVMRLGWHDRVSVIGGDVDAVIDEFDAVIARGFGPPDATLLSASRLVRPGGLVVVSEPPSDDDTTGDRWDDTWLVTADVERKTSESAAVAIFRRR